MAWWQVDIDDWYWDNGEEEVAVVTGAGWEHIVGQSKDALFHSALVEWLRQQDEKDWNQNDERMAGLLLVQKVWMQQS